MTKIMEPYPHASGPDAVRCAASDNSGIAVREGHVTAFRWDQITARVPVDYWEN